MFFKLAINPIQHFLTKLGFQPQYQPETNQIFVAIKKAGVELILFFRIFSHADLLQIVAYLPTQVKDESVSDVARLLNYINCELDMPGFCLDEKNSLVFYRIVIPCLQQRCNEELLEKYLKSIPEACLNFFKVIHGISSGEHTLSELLAQSTDSKE